MKVAVYDTFVRKHDGSVMHFDLVVPNSLLDTESIYGFGRQYLKKKGQSGRPLSGNECRFCHIKDASEQILKEIRAKGYFIQEMEGCN